MPPLIGRGVFADVAGLKRVDILAGWIRYLARGDRRGLEQAGVEVRSGETVLVHTGWGKHWRDPDTMLSGEPGIAKACAKWAVDHEIVCWGTRPVCHRSDPIRDSGRGPADAFGDADQGWHPADGEHLHG